VSRLRLQAAPGDKADEVSLVSGDWIDGLFERVHAELVAFNGQMTGHQDFQPLHVAVWDGDDLLAGLCGCTWASCGYVDLVWVRADYRRHGLGTQLLDITEKEIRRRGCDQVVLWTYSFQAPDFYIRAGYIESGRTSVFAHGYDQILLVKRLS
jgi:GNAT superfamily N-acetyltransferase